MGENVSVKLWILLGMASGTVRILRTMRFRITGNLQSRQILMEDHFAESSALPSY